MTHRAMALTVFLSFFYFSFFFRFEAFLTFKLFLVKIGRQAEKLWVELENEGKEKSSEKRFFNFAFVKTLQMAPSSQAQRQCQCNLKAAFISTRFCPQTKAWKMLIKSNVNTECPSRNKRKFFWTARKIAEKFLHIQALWDPNYFCGETSTKWIIKCSAEN